ncbi:MAG: hypothetical protein ABIS47_00670 [Acidimicrobiales bacterium]
MVTLVVVLGVGALALLRSRDSGVPTGQERVERQQACAPLLTFSSLLGDLVPTVPNPSPSSADDLFAKVGRAPEALIAAAPDKVRDDVRTLVGGLRAQPGDAAALRSPDFTLARERLAQYVGSPASGCQPGSGSGDG